MLPQLLGRPYSLEDEDDATAAAADEEAAGGAGDDAMDAEGPGAAETSSSRCGCTTEQLLCRVQVRLGLSLAPNILCLLHCAIHKTCRACSASVQCLKHALPLHHIWPRIASLLYCCYLSFAGQPCRCVG
jgi:hypothetical protein